ncbi:peptidase associated/transthyretin-like domain-containing protein [Aquimarina pacifica]|uniref:hypothetical protein n=1 Tax=Aquimarina pacifica TaxID=1296415 RepID=UPI001377A7A8|nr:hypothetical protein [Aquimarina pacifica]
MTKSLLFLFLLSSFQIFAQSNAIKGKIIADSLKGYAINIINFTQEIGTTNDDHGFFEIPAVKGDSLVFSSVQYETKSVVVTQDIVSQDIITVILRSGVEQLDQVNMSNVKLSGNLKKDMSMVAITPFVDNQILGLPFSDRPQPTLAERRIMTAKSGIIDRPLNYFSGAIEKLKEIKRIEDLKKIVQEGEHSLHKTFFIDSLKLPEELVTDFMYYCANDVSFKPLLRSPDGLALLEFFEKKIVSYKKHKEIE